VVSKEIESRAEVISARKLALELAVLLVEARPAASNLDETEKTKSAITGAKIFEEFILSPRQ
jgi:hypothetical protein